MSKRTKNGILVFVILGLIITAYNFGLTDYLQFSYLKSQQQSFQAHYALHPLQTLSLYFFIYVIVATLSIPGAAVLTLLAGGLFGVFTGTIIVSFASTIGATLSFLFSRFLLKEFVQKKFGDKLKIINDGVKKEGAFYLFTLRLIPAFPFFVINLLMGLTPMKTSTYFFVSQIGMLAGTLVFVNAGTQLATLESISGILSPSLVMSFAALGLLPLIIKKALPLLKKKRANEL